MKQENCWERCFLCGPYRGVISRTRLVVRQSPVNKDVNTEVEGSTALEAVTRRQAMKIQQTNKV
jgi:hypothetical protein